MDSGTFTSGRDMVLVAIPLIGLVGMSLFRLDQLIASRKRIRKQLYEGPHVPMDGEPVLRDPDGRVAEMPRRR